MPSSRLAPPRHFCLAASRHPTPHHTLGFTPFTSTSRKTTKNTPLAWSHGLDSIGTGDHIRKVRKGPAVFFVVARFLRPSRLDRVKRTRPSSSRAVAPRRALFTSVTAVLDSPVHWLSYSRGDGVLEHRFIPFGPLTQSTPRPELQAGLSGRKVVTYRFVPHPPPVPSSSHPPPSQALTLRLGSASLPYARPALCPHSQETRPLIFFFFLLALLVFVRPPLPAVIRPLARSIPSKPLSPTKSNSNHPSTRPLRPLNDSLATQEMSPSLFLPSVASCQCLVSSIILTQPLFYTLDTTAADQAKLGRQYLNSHPVPALTPYNPLSSLSTPYHPILDPYSNRVVFHRGR